MCMCSMVTKLNLHMEEQIKINYRQPPKVRTGTTNFLFPQLKVKKQQVMKLGYKIISILSG